MSSAGVLSFAQQGWEQVLAKVKWSVVYLDAACAESLHWSCGSSRLLEAVKGPACNLREFEPQAIGGGAQQPRAVFVLSCLLKGRTVDTLQDIIRRSHFQYCVVVTAVSHAVHLTANHVPAAAAAELEGQQPVFEQLEEKLCEWMGNVNYTAEVLHVPLLLAPAAPHLAFTPAFATLFPLLPRDVHLLNSARPDKRRLINLSEVDATSLTPELLLHIRCLVSGLSSLCEHLGVREECFAVGALSRVIATDLANYAPAKNRRKTATGRASVVFVDRTLDLTGRVTPGQLMSYIQLFKNNLKALTNHCGLLQLGMATVQTLKHPQTAKWDNFLAFERLLLQSLGDSTMAVVLNQLLPMIKSPSQRTSDDYSSEELLILLIYIYSVTGEFVLDKDLREAEDRVKKALAHVFSEESELSPLLQKITGCDSAINLTFPKSQLAVNDIFTSLQEIAGARTLMRQFKSVYVPGNHTHQASYKPLLKQVVEEIFNPEKPDPTDIEHTSSGLTDLLKTGFSMFMKVSRPHPSDHPLLILFVVGGITVSEAKMVKDLVASLKTGTQVMVLSTRLLKPLNIPELLFATDRLHPDLGF
ncbi:sec1 family domain-containing protein 2 isoform X6 [Cricetulus griseus]|uniref:Sec1 family domain-containing protein 2 isoform X6 n=1 Tax=Cricetulus griseus TaxID=10029 RepID=A0A9J7KBU7_CRIGR|nr:sec1 family domain-containing protein 2 isoform X6 [Cricetulus griseus]